MNKLTPAELQAVVKTIELLERDGWDEERCTADALRAWLKGKL